MLRGGAATRVFLNPGADRSAILLRRIARTSLAVGVLAAVLVETAGLHQIAVTGGNANPVELQLVAGGILVTAAVGALVALIVGLSPVILRKRNASRVPAPDAP